MTLSIQAHLDRLITQFGFPDYLHGVAANATRTAPETEPLPLTLSTREVTLERHPLDTLHYLLTTAMQGLQAHREPGALQALYQAAPTHLRDAVCFQVWQQSTDPNKNEPNWGERNAFSDLPRLMHAIKTIASSTLQAVPEQLRNEIYFQVWTKAPESDRGGENWGERNALVDLPRLMHAVKAVAEQRLASLPEQRKNSLYGTIHRMADLPTTSDPNWGEHHATEDTSRLIRALHRHGHLEIGGRQIPCFTEFENAAGNPSIPFHLNRKDPAKGQIGFINGMATTRDASRRDATTISDACAQGLNIHCVYSATTGNPERDIASGILGCGGISTPAVPLLLDQWQDFFENDPSSRLLQLCTSRGAIEVNNALALLPPELKERMIVITIAPACLIPADRAFRVHNLVIPSDVVPQSALNRHLLNAAHTVQLPEHTDTHDPHNLHGSSYRDWLTPRIDAYLRTNDILL